MADMGVVVESATPFRLVSPAAVAMEVIELMV
jgi:hypothetical protein